MKTLLLISSRFPFPPIGGDKLKTYHLIKILKKYYKIHFVCICDKPITQEMLDFCDNHFFKYKLFHKNKIQHFIAVTKTLFNTLPLQVNYYTFSDIKQYINNEIHSVDFAINILIRTSEYLITHQKTKFLDIVDSIGLNYLHSQKNVKSKFWKILYKFETQRLLKYETKCIQEYNTSFFVNYHESQFFKHNGKVKWIANGVDEKLLTYKANTSQYKDFLAFCGKMDYQPNIDAVLWFCENVFPKLNPKINLIIIGSRPTKKILSLQSSRIIVTGFVKDPYQINCSTFATIAPMQTGGGIQNKILEAMALEQIVITSELGANPIIGAVDRQNICIYRTAEEMIKIIHDIFESPLKYQSIKKQAKQLIAAKYLWQNYEKSLISSLENAIQ